MGVGGKHALLMDWKGIILASVNLEGVQMRHEGGGVFSVNAVLVPRVFGPGAGLWSLQIWMI